MKLVFVSEEFEKNIGINLVASYVDQIITLRFTYENCLTYNQLLCDEQAVSLPIVDIDPRNDVFCILYTSGTTGFPKGAMLTHENIYYAGKTVTECNDSTDQDVFLVAVPLFHVFGMVACFTASLFCQGKLVLQERFKAKHALQLIEQERVTIHHGVPTMFILELNEPDLETYDLSSLRTGYIAASPCPAEVIKGIREKLGLNICVAYGATETSATVTITKLENEKEINVLETVGCPVKGAEVRIVNDARENVPFGKVGEICCRGTGIMKGYYNAVEQTKAALDAEGWYYTGDLGILDETGYLRIVGRKKEMIIRGGFNIYPREIEEILYRNEKIMEAAVIGLPDPVLGEYVCAVIKLKPGNEAAVSYTHLTLPTTPYV
jgi:fatty-acyl-CoA synthase/long-chain acyl-CoA synthetase